MANHMITLEGTLDHIRLRLLQKKQTVSIAESVTAGNLQAVFSLATDATLFFQGGLTTYNLGQKTRLLDIDPIEAARSNCVDDSIAVGMAKSVQKLFCSDWGIGVTGYAAPVPEWNVVENLFAYYAFAHKNGHVESGKMEIKEMSMKKVQLFYVEHILILFDEHLHSL